MKRWLGWRLGAGLGLEAARRGLNAMTRFAQFCQRIGVTALADVNRVVLERYLAGLHVELAGRQRHGDQIGQLNSFLHAVRQHHWDDTLPATALVFTEDYPARVERPPRALAEQVMAQIEHPDNLARLNRPGFARASPAPRAVRGHLGPVSSRFVRRVRTASGAVAVQLVVKDHGEVVEIEHVGSAHSDAELALLLAAASERLQPGQQALDLGELVAKPARVSDTADWTRPGSDQPPAAADPAPTSAPFAALAVSRHLQDATGTSIKNIVHTLRTVRSATVRLGGHEITLDPDIAAAAKTILDRLPPKGHHTAARVRSECGFEVGLDNSFKRGAHKRDRHLLEPRCTPVN